jgi:ribulose 1,5-bisphosphate carboxylase large subunit-like protein
MLRNDEFRALFCSADSIDLNHYVVVAYKLTPKSGIDLQQAAARIALISSVGTLEPLPFETPVQRLNSAARILQIKEPNDVSIAFPIELCGRKEGLTQLLGVLFFASEFNWVDEFWIEDVNFPRTLLDSWQGPRFGVAGIRDKFGINRRPLIGVIVKPRHGVELARIAKEARAALIGGADYIVDDELIVDPDGEMAFERRVREFVRVTIEASNETMEQKWFFANVGASPRKALGYAKLAATLGVGGLVVNTFTMGVGAIEDLASDDEITLPIITTNMGAAVVTRRQGTGTGFADAVFDKMSRIAGSDAVHTGISASDWYANAWGMPVVGVRSPLGNHKTAFVVVAGGLNTANLWQNIRALGGDLMLEAGSGILSYPKGAHVAAKAMRKMVEEFDPEMSDEAAKATTVKLSKDRAIGGVLTYFMERGEQKWST